MYVRIWLDKMCGGKCVSVRGSRDSVVKESTPLGITSFFEERRSEFHYF